MLYFWMDIPDLSSPFYKHPYENNITFFINERIIAPPNNFILAFVYALYIIFIFLLLVFYWGRNGFIDRTNNNGLIRLAGYRTQGI